MRPKLILIAAGSAALALFDMVAVVLTLPMMQIVTGTPPADSAALRAVQDLTGLQTRTEMLIAILIGVIAMLVLKNVSAIAFRWWSLGIMADAQTDAAHGMLALYAQSPWERHRLRSRSDIYQTMTGYVGSAFSTTSDLILFFVDIIAALAVMIALLAVSPVATLVAFLFFGGAAWILQAVLKKAQGKLGEKARLAGVETWSHLAPVIDGFKEARVAGASARFASAYANARRTAAFANRDLGVLSELPKAILEVLMVLGVLLVAGTLLLTQDSNQAFAFLGVFVIGAIRIVPGLNRAVSTLGRIRSSLPNLDAFVSLIKGLRKELPGTAPQKAGSHSFPQCDIHVDNVSYTFPDADGPVLRDVSGIIPQGHTVALVGSSGAGKTTFVEILLGLFTPDSGSVTADGVNVHTFVEDWWAQLGMVAQDVFVMPRTLRENVAFGLEGDEIDDARVLEALEQAQLQDVVNAMPDGIYTVLGEQGMRVSGGQRQRIGIARALYRQPQVLILDEATSALDNETESRITQTLRDLHGKITIVVVAHRLSTVKHADQILFFSRGSIVARGTMQELTQQNEEFANLVRLGQLN